MGKWIKKFELLIWAATLAGGLIFTTFQTFATIKYVDEKNQTLLEAIHEVRDGVEMVDERTWELAGESGPPPKKHHYR